MGIGWVMLFMPVVMVVVAILIGFCILVKEEYKKNPKPVIAMFSFLALMAWIIVAFQLIERGI